MAMAESLDARLARLEGSYEQIDKRLGSIEDRLGRLESRVDMLLYGIVVAILVPIAIRVFFP